MNLKEKQKKLKELLKLSSLPKISQETIIENIERIEEKYLNQMIKALEKEQQKFGELEKLFRKFEEKKNKGWKELEKKQQKTADKFIEQTVKEVIKDVI